MQGLKIQILVDNPDSWIIEYAAELVLKLINSDHEARLVNSHDEVEKGHVLCILACEKIFKKLGLNQYNLVVHESDLPKGKGWSPVTWQVLEGKTKIPVTLFEAAESVDSGDIYAQDFIELNGNELLSEIKHKQGLITQKLILDFINKYPNFEGRKQQGKSSFYPRRTSKDSELDVHKSIASQFDLLRVVDNERYPAFFKYKNKTFVLKIYSSND